MRVEVVAVGTELLLGQIVDTNSAWLGEQLAAAGLDCHWPDRRRRQPRPDGAGAAQRARTCRRSDRLRWARADAGRHHPRGDRRGDERRRSCATTTSSSASRRCSARAAGRWRPTTSGRRTCPKGATVIEQTRGTAPGLICPVGHKVVYAVPGVPYEMKDMFERAVLPDLLARSGEAATIRSRVLRTWGLAESLAGRAARGSLRGHAT